ncbi:ankyrin repeat domain-containing protein [uncultured Pseudoalteromonas sp.]|uniref:ankyrin repeat domain-containing protein n=1 Tax=uncultured Pseudoalteromonas sp. TaxID=114053 RepID=UPI00259294E9|nr:ankyrin repeat domain-containing protein [uncultured Pseudoalteromonas sp.]
MQKHTHTAIVVLMILFSFKVYAKTVEQQLPPLHQAIIKGDLRQVKQLVNNGADINRLDSHMGNSPAHIAAQSDYPDILKFLLDKGAFINLQTPRSGFTPLMVAAWYSKPKNINVLMSYPSLNLELKTPRGFKAESLVGGWDKSISPSEEKRYAALRQLFIDKNQHQEQLLSQQKILNVIEDTSLNERAKVEKINSLIAKGYNVNERRPVYSSGNDWHTPLLIASRDGYTEIVKTLLANGADQTIVGYPMDAIAFHKAGYMGHSEIVKLLLEAPKADEVLNSQGPNNGYTPLHDAIWHGNTAAAKAFINAGANQHLTTYEKDTPKQLATRYQYNDILKLLE